MYGGGRRGGRGARERESESERGSEREHQCFRVLTLVDQDFVVLLKVSVRHGTETLPYGCGLGHCGKYTSSGGRWLVFFIWGLTESRYQTIDTSVNRRLVLVRQRFQLGDDNTQQPTLRRV